MDSCLLLHKRKGQKRNIFPLHWKSQFSMKRKSFKRVQWGSSSHLFLVTITAVKSRKLLFWKLCQSSLIIDNKIVPPPQANHLLPYPWWLLVPGLSHKCIWTLLLLAAPFYKQLETGGTPDLEEPLQWKFCKSGSLSSSWTPVHRCWGCFQRQWGPCKHEHSSTQRALLGKGWFLVGAGGTQGFVQQSLPLLSGIYPWRTESD